MHPPALDAAVANSIRPTRPRRLGDRHHRPPNRTPGRTLVDRTLDFDADRYEAIVIGSLVIRPSTRRAAPIGLALRSNAGMAASGKFW